MYAGDWAGSSCPVQELRSPDCRHSKLQHPASPPVFVVLASFMASFTSRALQLVVSSNFIFLKFFEKRESSNDSVAEILAEEQNLNSSSVTKFFVILGGIFAVH